MNTRQKLNTIDGLARFAVQCDHDFLHEPVLELIQKVVDEGKPAPIAQCEPEVSRVPTIEELGIAAREGKVAAIRAYRQRTDSGLKEAKDTVEAMMEKVGICDKYIRDQQAAIASDRAARITALTSDVVNLDARLKKHKLAIANLLHCIDEQSNGYRRLTDDYDAVSEAIREAKNALDDDLPF